jgi:two-component system sensor histidine kinase KdpD
MKSVIPLADRLQPRSFATRSLWVVSACALPTLLAWPWRDFLDPANTAMLYLLAVAVVAARAGRGAAIATSLSSTALLDFFFIHPRYTFIVGDVQYVVTLAVMLVVALIIGNLTLMLQREKGAALEREQQSRALYELASRLSGATSLEQLAIATRDFLHDSQACRNVLLMSHNDVLQPVEIAHRLDSTLQEVAAFAALQRAETRTLLDDSRYWLFLPLHGTTYVRGVLAIDAGVMPLDALDARRPLFEAIAALVATAVERLHFVDVAQRAQLQMTDERLRSSILSALSHDIRTPLTVLYGMSDALVQQPLPPDVRETAEAMREQALRLNGMVSNLLDMAKLRAGDLRLNPEWQPLEEVVGASIKLLGLALQQHPVQVTLQPDLPLLKFDAILMERVLCNLLENAAKYSPPGSAIRISANTADGNAAISVCNDGSRFPPGNLDNMFELFGAVMLSPMFRVSGWDSPSVAVS